jgi:Lipopolysaccharide-assembly
MRLPGIILAGVAAAFLGGCAGYHLGPVNGATAGAKSVEVLPFNNQTLQPRLGDAVTQSLRERFQTDGTYHLATQDGGDIVVSGVITRYNRIPLSYLDSDVTTAQSYRINITAHVVVRERASTKALLDKDVSGYTLVTVGSDLASAERQAAPLLAEDLAQNIAELVNEGAW